LYAPLEIWRGHYVQTIVQVVQSHMNVELYEDKGCAPTSLIGRNDIGRLYWGPPRCRTLQWKSWNHLAVRVQGIIVKIHDQDPYAPGGDYDRILASLDEL
jgi:hypothetical protein